MKSLLDESIKNLLLLVVMLIPVMFIGNLLLSYLDLPDVYINHSTKECIKVVNFKNGDNFTCKDKDITLRQYNVVFNNN